MDEVEKTKNLLLNKKFNVAVVGSRTFELNEKNVLTAVEFLESIISPDDIDKFISGGAKGADEFAFVFKDYYEKDIEVFIPDWKRGKHAGFNRNRKIVEAADIVIAFWDGRSRGTAHTLKLAKEMRKEFHIYHFEVQDNTV